MVEFGAEEIRFVVQSRTLVRHEIFRRRKAGAPFNNTREMKVHPRPLTSRNLIKAKQYRVAWNEPGYWWRSVYYCENWKVTQNARKNRGHGFRRPLTYNLLMFSQCISTTRVVSNIKIGTVSVSPFHITRVTIELAPTCPDFVYCITASTSRRQIERGLVKDWLKNNKLNNNAEEERFRMQERQ